MNEELKKAFEALGIKSSAEASNNETDIDLLKAEIGTLQARVNELTEENESLRASAGSTDLEKAVNGMDSKFSSLGAILMDIHKSVTGLDLGEAIKNAIPDSGKDMIKLTKAINDVADSVDELSDKFNDYLDSPNDRKSYSEKDIKFLEKAFMPDNDGNKMLSKSQHRNEIVELLDGLAGEEGTDSYNEKYADAVVRFETSGELTKAVIDDLMVAHKVRIIS